MLASPTAKSYALLTGVVNEYLHDGHRAKDPEKGKKDTELLLKALEKDPENSRYVFYLAQSYNGIGDLHEAIKFYEKRATMGGDEEEVFCSLKYAGTLQRYLGFKQEVFMENFYKAFLLRPSRAEPLFEMTKHFIAIGNHLLGYLVAKFALRIPAPFGLLVETWIYDWGILLQLYLCALELEYYSAAYEALKKLLFLPNLPAELREGYEPHLDWLAKKIFAKN
jgi:tetratricopeptide (TPR) repeat protein